MLYRFLFFAVLALLLAGCEAGLFFGGLPSNDACRDAESLPGHPISTECLDTLGHERIGRGLLLLTAREGPRQRNGA